MDEDGVVAGREVISSNHLEESAERFSGVHGIGEDAFGCSERGDGVKGLTRRDAVVLAEEVTERRETFDMRHDAGLSVGG